MIPLVEFAFETPLNREDSGNTTGSINPGIIWSGLHFQIGAEATIPANKSSGNHVGILFQLHFYLDDLLPRSLGKPIFGD